MKTTDARQFDPQPFHLDNQAARISLFGDLATSGWHTAAITMRLLETLTRNQHGEVLQRLIPNLVVIRRP